MRIVLKLFLFITVISLITGCMINPSYHSRDLTQPPGITGIWEAQRDSGRDNPFDTWEIRAADSGRFRFIHNDGYNPRHFIGGFFRLGTTLYLDLAALKVIDGRPPREQAILHTILNVQTGDTLRVRALDADYFEKQVKSGKIKLRYELATDHSSDFNIGTTMFITADTDELQAFLKNSGGDMKLFSGTRRMTLVRGDTGFRHYFPEGSFDLTALKQRPDAPDIVKQSYTRSWKAQDLNAFAILDSLRTAPSLYRPYYFRLALAAVESRSGTVDTNVATQYSEYVLNHTMEFVHFFNGGPTGDEGTLRAWADILSQYANHTSSSDKTILMRLEKAAAAQTSSGQRIMNRLISAYKDLQQRSQGPGRVRD